MQVYLYDLMVLRSMHTQVQTTVPRHEADLLRAVHGADGVELLAPEPVGSMAVAAVYEERERLRLKYGTNETGTSWVDAVYPNDTALAQAMEAGAVEAQAANRSARGKKAAEDATAV